MNIQRNMYKNKSPYSHSQNAQNIQNNGQLNYHINTIPRSPAHLTDNNALNANTNATFSQALINNNISSNKNKMGALPVNNQNNGFSGMFKKPNVPELNLQCDEVLIKNKPDNMAAQVDFICNESLIPIGAKNQATTLKAVDKVVMLTERQETRRQQSALINNVNNYPNPNSIGGNSMRMNHVGPLIDLKCNQQLFDKQKQNSMVNNKCQLEQIKRRVEGVLDYYQKVVVQQKDIIMRLQAENQLLKMRGYTK